MKEKNKVFYFLSCLLIKKKTQKKSTNAREYRFSSDNYEQEDAV